MSSGSDSTDPARDSVALLLALFQERERAQETWQAILKPYSEGADATGLVVALADIVIGLGGACGMSNRQLRDFFAGFALELANEAAPIR
jgi:hypothetical protein